MWFGYDNYFNTRQSYTCRCDVAKRASLSAILSALETVLRLEREQTRAVNESRRMLEYLPSPWLRRLIIKTDERFAAEAIRVTREGIVPSVHDFPPGTSERWWRRWLQSDRCIRALRSIVVAAMLMIRCLRENGIDVYVWQVQRQDNASAHDFADTGL